MENKELLKQYMRGPDPEKRERSWAWLTAIGLQEVDGLKTSEYLLSIALRNVKGEISMKEAQALLDDYYKKKMNQEAQAGKM